MTLLKIILVNSISTVPIAASKIKLAEQRIPIAALHHSVAAVVSPLTDLSSFMITPAPKKPIPDNTWAVNLAGSILACELYQLLLERPLSSYLTLEKQKKT